MGSKRFEEKFIFLSASDVSAHNRLRYPYACGEAEHHPAEEPADCMVVKEAERQTEGDPDREE